MSLTLIPVRPYLWLFANLRFDPASRLPDHPPVHDYLPACYFPVPSPSCTSAHHDDVFRPFSTATSSFRIVCVLPRATLTCVPIPASPVSLHHRYPNRTLSKRHFQTSLVLGCIWFLHTPVTMTLFPHHDHYVINEYIFPDISPPKVSGVSVEVSVEGLQPHL